MRRVVLLAGGVLLAAAGVFLHSGGADSQPPARIEGTALDGPRASGLGPAENPKPDTAAPKPAAKLELDHMTLVGDHYEAPLGDKQATLTLDPELQDLAEKLLTESRAPKGAIVAMTPDGKILALAGRAADDPKGSTKGAFDWHLATEPWGPAASVFKLVTASALVASGVDPDDKICFHGGIRSVTESNLRDSPHDSACQSLAWGVAHSNNALVGKLAFQRLEPARLAQYAHDLFGEIPASFAAPATFGELALPDAQNLEYAQAAAGFTGSKLSVLGGALLAATFATGGERPAPRLIGDAPAAARRVLPEAIAAAVSKMMVGTCRYGSAAKSFGRKDMAVAGKTGTLTRTDPFYMEHSWFVGYAPAEHPQIVVAVLLGNAENWHLRGQEAARRLIDRAVRRAEDREHKSAVRPSNHWR
jgi:cell division protein FtsI/penicillin-binding protein 2